MKLICTILEINKSIKTRYVRESKMSLHKEEEIMKATIERKKWQKKINEIIKEELDQKIFPDKKTKEQILEKIQGTNKKASRLLTEHRKMSVKNAVSSHQEEAPEIFRSR